MRQHRGISPRQPDLRSALTVGALLFVSAAPAVVGTVPASAEECPIDVARYGYTLAAAQSALNAVSSTCREIVFTPGTYEFSGTFTVSTGSVTVRGEPGATIKAAPGATISYGLIKIGASDVNLTDLSLDGSAAPGDGIRVAGTKAVITGASLTNVTARPIFVATAAGDASISGCKVTGFGERGVVTYGDRTTIDGCTVTGGTSATSIAMWALSADHPSLINNTIANNAGKAMEFSSATNFTAAGNDIHDNGLLGIHMLRSKTGLVENNVVHHNKNNGIDAHGGQYVTIRNNRSYFNGGPRQPDTLEGQGILIFCSQHMKVLNNTVWNNSQGQPGVRSGIQVSDNSGQNNELLTLDVLVDGNTAYDDQQPDSAATQKYAIHIGGSAGNMGDLDLITVTNNTGYGNINAGVYTKGLAVGSTSYFANNKLTGRSPATIPKAPTNVTATAGDASATVTWSAPSSDGDSPITSYTVTSSPDGITKAVGPNDRSAAVSGLRNGTSYTFKVRATNT